MGNNGYRGIGCGHLLSQFASKKLCTLVQDFNDIFCHPERSRRILPKHCLSTKGKILPLHYVPVRMTEINNMANFIVKRLLIVIKQPMDFQPIVVKFKRRDWC